jgi:hypothetical protein
LKCPNYPSEDEVREAEIGLGDTGYSFTASYPVRNTAPRVYDDIAYNTAITAYDYRSE